MQPGVFNCLCARAPVCVWGSTSPDVLSSVFPDIYNTESRASARPQHRFCVCKGRGGRAAVWCLFYPLHKTSPGSVVSGDSILWSSSPQQQNKHLRACQKVHVSQDQEETRVVCKRTKVSITSIPGDFPFKTKHIDHNFTSILFFLSVFP